MAEAMCGPSNALQQFKQHSSVDRTLQQDRLGARFGGSSQGFRSSSPRAPVLDGEFEAFQAGVEPTFLGARPFHPAGQIGGPVQAPSWATDFQSLSISSPPMMQQPQPFVATQSTPNWAQAFRNQFAPSAPRAQLSSSPQAFQQRARFGLSSFQNTFSMPSLSQPSFMLNAQPKGREAVLDQFDDSAFERAFDQARDDMFVVEDATLSATETMQQSTTIDPIENAFSNVNFESTIPNHLQHEQVLPVDAQQTVQQEQQPQHVEDDALAMTAQELLEKVEHNQSDKFKNSQFLGLMRKLRDREMRVEGDKMVETTTDSAATVAQDATLNANSTYLPPASRAYHEHHVEPQYMGDQPTRDGQDVVNLLNEPGFTEDMGMPSKLPEGPSFEDDPYDPYDPSERPLW